MPMGSPDIITVTGRSDDQAFFEFNGKLVGPDYSEAWGQWFHLVVDGQHVADISIDFDGDWPVTVRSAPGHTLAIDFPLHPDHVDDCRCDDCDAFRSMVRNA